MNAIFAHFIEFNLRFGMVEDKELEVLDDLMIALKLKPPKGDAAEQATAAAAAAEENKENVVCPNSANGVSTSDSPVICTQPTASAAAPSGDSSSQNAPTSQDVEMAGAEAS